MAGPGDLIFKPRNQWHTFWNAGDEPARILEIIAPSGFERFFDELVDLGGAVNADPRALAELCERYGLEMRPRQHPRPHRALRPARPGRHGVARGPRVSSVRCPRTPRATAFDGVADLYERARPGYPEAVFDDLATLRAPSGAGPHPRDRLRDRPGDPAPRPPRPRDHVRRAGGGRSRRGPRAQLASFPRRERRRRRLRELGARSSRASTPLWPSRRCTGSRRGCVTPSRRRCCAGGACSRW